MYNFKKKYLIISKNIKENLSNEDGKIQANFRNTRFLFCLLLLFFLPINQYLSTILILINFVLNIIDYKNINITKLIKNSPLVVFFLCYIVIGSISREFFLFKHIEYKLSFLALPVILHNFNYKQLKLLFKSYLLGLFVFYIMLLLLAFLSSYQGGFNFNYKVNPNSYSFFENGLRGGNYFLGDYFTRNLQSSYFSLYYSFGIILLYYFKIFNKKVTTALCVLFGVAIIQSMSKAGIVLVLIILLVITIKNIKEKKPLSILIFISIISIVYFINPRIKSSVSTIISDGLILKKDSPESIDLRLLTWDSSIDAAKENLFFGYGITEAQIALNRAYVEKNYRFPLLYRLNAHNTYLQILIEGGMLLLLVFIIVQFYLLFKFGNTELIFGFTTLCFISFLFESFFSRYMGISFFAIFYTLILNFYEEKKV